MISSPKIVFMWTFQPRDVNFNTFRIKTATSGDDNILVVQMVLKWNIFSPNIANTCHVRRSRPPRGSIISSPERQSLLPKVYSK